MPAVINTTPTKQLTSCDALAGAVFTTIVSGCNLNIVNQSSLTGITNIEYEISLGATVVDTINTTSTTYVWDAASLYYGETVSIKQTITSSSGTFSVTESVGIPSSLSVCVFEYTTNLAGGDTFSPSSAPTSGTTLWRVPDDTYIRNLSPSVGGSTVGFDGTNNTVIVRPTGGLSALAQIDISSEKVVGFLDCSPLTNTTTILANNNTNITSVDVSDCVALTNFQIQNASLTALSVAGISTLQIFYCAGNSSLTTLNLEPTASYTDIRAFNCNIGSLDFSGMTFGANAIIWFTNNTNLTTLTMPTAVSTITAWIFDGCTSLSGTIDLTWANFSATGLTQCRMANCTGVTAIDHTGRSGMINRYLMPGSGLTGVPDISMFTYGTSAQIRYDGTTITGLSLNLTAGSSIAVFDFSTSAIGVIDLGNNTITASANVEYDATGQTAAEVNENLVNIRDAAVTSGATGAIGIGGVGNAAPDGSSGGFDGLTAKADLIAAGYTVTTN